MNMSQEQKVTHTRYGTLTIEKNNDDSHNFDFSNIGANAVPMMDSQPLFPNTDIEADVDIDTNANEECECERRLSCSITSKSGDNNNNNNGNENDIDAAFYNERIFQRILGNAIRLFLPLLFLAFGYGALVASSRGNNGDRWDFGWTYSALTPTASISNTTGTIATAAPKIEPTAPITTGGSPFFESVLEWNEVPLAESPSHYDYDSNNNRSGTTEGATTSNHYRASIEFCSDPDRGLYGYGPVGNCVPGKAAPLIRMKPKRFYHLTLFNNAHIDTNLHTHGLHVSGVGTVDDVTRVAKPGECLTYEYYILDDADVGTFWYHPHRHPLVTKSAFGGAYGMLIVDETVAVENNRFYPEHLVNFLTKTEVLLQFSSMYNKKLAHAVRSNKVNGKDGLDLYLSRDAHYYFRVSSVVYAESVTYLEFNPPDACDVRIVAYDGVYRSEIPGPSALHKHMMTVSSRADFAVRCSRDADIHFHQGKLGDESRLVKIHVVSPEEESQLNSQSLSKLLPQSNGSTSNVVTLLQDPNRYSSPYLDVTTNTTWKPRRPYYMPDLSDSTNIVDEYWSVSMDDYFVNGTKGVSVNQYVWDPAKSIRTFQLGQLVEYPILLSQSHPYHAHINRMQIVEPGGCGGRFEEGEYFDTIVQSKDHKGECRIRTKFFDFAGRVVIHCHRWSHEDQGMMTWIDVLGGHGHEIEAGPATNCASVL